MLEARALGDGRGIGAAVKNHEHAALEIESLEVAVELIETAIERVGPALD